MPSASSFHLSCELELYVTILIGSGVFSRGSLNNVSLGTWWAFRIDETLIPVIFITGNYLYSASSVAAAAARPRYLGKNMRLALY